MRYLIALMLLLNMAIAQANTCTALFARYSIGMPAIIPVGLHIESSNDPYMRFVVAADPSNQYFNADKNAYLVPADVKSIDVKVARDSGASAGSVPIGYINLLADALPYIDTVQNDSDLTNC